MSLLHRNLRFSWRLFSSYIKKNWHLFIFGLMVGLFLVFILPLVFRSSTERIIGISGNYTVSTLPLSIQKKISLGLAEILDDGMATRSAAISWQATDSGKIVNFLLRNNLYWHDGTKFTANDINYNLKGVTIQKVDNYQITFKLLEPFAPLSSVVSQPLFKNGLTGLSEWKVSGIKFNGRFISSINLLNTNSLEKITYKFFASDKDLLIGLKLGSVNEIITTSNISDFNKDSHYQINTIDSQNKLVLVFFNMKGKLGDEKSVRQGLVYALPNNYDFGLKADSPIASTNWAYNRGVKDYAQNLETAKKMTGGTGTSSAQVKILLAIDKSVKEAGKIVESSWKSVGVDVQSYLTDVIPTNFDAYLTTVDLPSDPDQYFRWHSTQEANISGYRSPKIDRLLEDGRRTMDMEARKEIYFNFQKAITEDVPAAFLYFPREYEIRRK